MVSHFKTAVHCRNSVLSSALNSPHVLLHISSKCKNVVLANATNLYENVRTVWVFISIYTRSNGSYISGQKIRYSTNTHSYRSNEHEPVLDTASRSSSYFMQLVPSLCIRYPVRNVRCNVRKTRAQAIAYFADSSLCKKNRSALYVCDRTSTNFQQKELHESIIHCTPGRLAGLGIYTSTAVSCQYEYTAGAALSVRCHPLLTFSRPYLHYDLVISGHFYEYLVQQQ